MSMSAHERAHTHTHTNPTGVVYMLASFDSDVFLSENLGIRSKA